MLLFLLLGCGGLLFADDAVVDKPALTWAGDMRLRAQAEKNGDNDTRWLERLRLRFGVAAQVDPELRAEIRLGTAYSNRSLNQNLGDNSDPGAPRRSFGLDLGYIAWKPVFFAQVYGGRIPQLQYRPGASQVILDENNSLEGAALVLDYNFDESWRALLNAGSVIIRDNYDNYYSMAQSDNMINWTQVRGEWKSGRWKFTAGGGFFNYTSLKGKNFSDLVRGGTANGNSEAAPGVIKNPYLVREYFLDFMLPVGNVDLNLFSQRLVNGEVAVGNSGWWTGIGCAQKAWDAQIAYVELQPDVVPALFTYADFANGTTDSRGYLISARWKFARNMSFKVIQFLQRTQASTLNKEYNRTNLDLSATF